ncbi:MAG: trehalase family glycosidase [Planctomycetota bacterium]
MRLPAALLVTILLSSAPAALTAPQENRRMDAKDPGPWTDPLKAIGGRSDKGAAGQGRQIAIYCRENPEVHFATHELGPVFSPIQGKVSAWYPDHVELEGGPGPGLPGTRRIGVTQDDVVVMAWTVPAASEERRLSWTIHGDARSSQAWRGEAQPDRKSTELLETGALIHDAAVYPEITSGLFEVFGASLEPASQSSSAPGSYRCDYEATLPAGEEWTFVAAIAFDPDREKAETRLKEALDSEDPLGQIAEQWRSFYSKSIPRFQSSDEKWNRLWLFRWFLLRLSTAGGDLGFFRYPVVMEGRDAYQTYCCFSAPFMALDLNWATDPRVGAGHWENMAHCSYDDGRFPWYSAPNTNRVPLHHASATGASFLQHAAWQHYLIHGDLGPIREVYPAFRKNLQWWLKERDPQGTGLFRIDHLLETGMDDLDRGEAPILAVDATSYLHANFLALSGMARVLGHESEAATWEMLADRSRDALAEQCWDEDAQFYFDLAAGDRSPQKVRTIAGFYPFFGGAAGKEQLPMLDQLFDPKRFAAPYPIPALSRDEPGFDPVSFWMGPNWPAATCHVLQGFAQTAKTLDRGRLPKAAELLERCVSVFFTPEIDFYERYQPLTGRGLSQFRDYMHSWWIDLIVRHVVGLTPREDGRLDIDPLPLSIDWFALDGVHYHGRIIDITWQRPDQPKAFEDRPSGLSVRVDGEVLLQREGLGRLTEE